MGKLGTGECGVGFLSALTCFLCLNMSLGCQEWKKVGFRVIDSVLEGPCVLHAFLL